MGFNLGILLSDTSLYQQLDMTGSIRGSGFSRDQARFNLISEISRLGINGYDYQRISTNATMAEGFFNGNLIIDDPSLNFSGNLSLDLNSSPEIIKIKADLGMAILDTLKITNKPATLRSSLNVDMRGLALDDITGTLFFENTLFTYGEKDFFAERMNLTSEKDSLGRALRIESPITDLALSGQFDYSVLFKDAVDLYKEYSVLFRNRSQEILEFYKDRKSITTSPYEMDFSINPKGINDLFNLFDINLMLSTDTKIAGTILGGEQRKFEVLAEMSRFDINNFTFAGNNVHIESEKRMDTTLVFASYKVRSNEQFINAKSVGHQLAFDADWKGNLIDLAFRVSQANSSNYLSTSANVEFVPDATHIHINPTELSLIDKIWQVSENNKLILENEKYSINNLSIYNGDQKINFNGVLSTDPDENLFISIVNFDFENLNPLITKKLDGVLNGFIDVKDFFRERKIDSRLNLRDFKINDFLVGNVIAFSEYDNKLRNFDVNLDVITNGKQTMLINGKFDPGDDINQLDLHATFTSANINLIQPFYEDIISDVGGQLDGKVTIKGKLKNLVINGSGKTSGGEFTLDYLKTHYKLDGEVVFDEHNIQFLDFKLRDHHNNEGAISGAISHKAFKELSYDFNGSMKNFLVLNTTPKDNNLYYGTAYATGNLRIFGKEKILNISATATSAPGTRFYIPLDGGGEVIKEDFINFISIKDTVALQKRTESKKVNLAGINLNFDIDITRDAYCEIIFDATAGDIIRGHGNGKINLQIDTKGDFNMYGDYTIEEGWYNFTLYNVINKEFQIEPSSKISWIGDPYEAILDIKANYQQLASLTPILRATQDDIDQNPELGRKYPAKVLLGITGNLMAPSIEFGIDIDEYPKNANYNGVSYETHISAFKNKLSTDEQELKRQVFSLIILKNFSSENAFNVGGSVEKSVSEFISNQISYWVTQFDENLIIDVDLGSLDEEAFNTFQLRMSYSFMDGRLRVTRDGGFSDAATGTNVASVLGDWSVEYLLTNDGKLRAKIYNRTNYNTLNPEVKSASTTAGFSILHTTSFDKVKEIFKKARDQNRPPSNNQPASTPEPTEPISKQ